MLAGRYAAITSEVAGTTRDVIEVRMDINGFAVTLLDTAGLRDAADPLEKLGIERALQRAEQADLRLFLESDEPFVGISPRPDDLVVRGKSDLSGRGVSGKTGAGVPELIASIGEKLQVMTANVGILTRERHRRALLQAIKAMESSKHELQTVPTRVEIASAELHSAIRALESLVGQVDVENLLDEIFASFCIGK